MLFLKLNKYNFSEKNYFKISSIHLTYFSHNKYIINIYYYLFRKLISHKI